MQLYHVHAQLFLCVHILIRSKRLTVSSLTSDCHLHVAGTLNIGGSYRALAGLDQKSGKLVVSDEKYLVINQSSPVL